MASAAESQKEQRRTDLARDYAKARDLLESLKAQRSVGERNVREAQEVERLTYESYRAGKTNYLDVQSADLRLFEARVAAAQIESQILVQTARLDYLAAR